MVRIEKTEPSSSFRGGVRLWDRMSVYSELEDKIGRRTEANTSISNDFSFFGIDSIELIGQCLTNVVFAAKSFTVTAVYHSSSNNGVQAFVKVFLYTAIKFCTSHNGTNFWMSGEDLLVCKSSLFRCAFTIGSTQWNADSCWSTIV